MEMSPMRVVILPEREFSVNDMTQTPFIPGIRYELVPIGLLPCIVFCTDNSLEPVQPAFLHLL